MEDHAHPNLDRLITHAQAQEPHPASTPTSEYRPHRRWQRYLYAVCLVAAASLIGGLVGSAISPTNLVMIYLLVVVVAAVYWGRGPAVVVSVLSVLTFDFFLVPPHLTFAVSDTEYLLTFVGLLVVGVVISQLAARFREQLDIATRREAEMTALYALGRDLAVASQLDDIANAIVGNMSQTFERQVVVLLPTKEGAPALKPIARSPRLELDEDEMAVASWAFGQGQAAGRGTDALSAAMLRYLPLKTSHGVVGVIGLAPSGSQTYLTPEQRRLSEACASLAAVAIERAQLAEAAGKAQLLEATEKLQTALLNSISHDLRTPLVSITGVLTSLQDAGTRLDTETRENLIENAREEAERLNRIVGNLLDMTRIEAGAMNVAKEPCDVQDLIGTALEQMSGHLGSRAVAVDVPPDLPLVPLDFGLLVQVLVNVIDNALKYSPPGSPLEVRAQIIGRQAEVQVADRGLGIPSQDLSRVFDRFYREPHPANVAGTGMGLFICKGIVEAHGGQIHAENRTGGGTIVKICLPLDALETPKVRAV
jgi:two-component system, OmpR family, sensor histidine kinase KdpD